MKHEVHASVNVARVSVCAKARGENRMGREKGKIFVQWENSVAERTRFPKIPICGVP